MDTLTLKIPETLKELLNTYSRKKGISRSSIVRSALLDYFTSHDAEKKISFLDFSEDLAGSIEGPADLSTNTDYLNGYGK